MIRVEKNIGFQRDKQISSLKSKPVKTSIKSELRKLQKVQLNIAASRSALFQC